MRYFYAYTLLFVATASAQTGIISTVAGNGDTGYNGDNIAATSAELNVPVFTATDPGGNIYIADQFNNRIRKVDTSGQITTIAGTGTAGSSGDGGPAVAAELNTPIGVFVDRFGNILIADVGNQTIRKIDTNGIITTVAGSGAQGYGGDGGPAVDAAFYNPVRCVEDSVGNLYIADQSNHRVREVDTNGIVATFAGTGVQGFSGDGGPATAAELNNPTALAFDQSGDLFIADQFNQRIREVNTSGVITTVAGNSNMGYTGDGGPATSATLNYPGGLVVDTSGNIFFNDEGNNVVREVAADGTITTAVGNGSKGFTGDGGPAISAELNGNFGVALDPSGDLLIADSDNQRIRLVSGISSVAPTFVSLGVTNAASFQTGGSAGALATLFGQHLSVNLNGIKGASATPLPVSLAGTSITVNGVNAPLIAVVNVDGQEQINFQMPWEVAGQSTVSVVVNNGVSANPAVSASLTAEQPGIFLIDGVNGAIEHVDGSVVSASNPAAPGEAVVVYCNGLGPVSPEVTDGVPASGTTLSNTSVTPTVTVGGLPATVLFSGLAPYLVGLNQLNIQLPTSLPAGAQPLVISSGGITSNTAQIQIQ